MQTNTVDVIRYWSGLWTTYIASIGEVPSSETLDSELILNILIQHFSRESVAFILERYGLEDKQESINNFGYFLILLIGLSANLSSTQLEKFTKKNHQSQVLSTDEFTQLEPYFKNQVVDYFIPLHLRVWIKTNYAEHLFENDNFINDFNFIRSQSVFLDESQESHPKERELSKRQSDNAATKKTNSNEVNFWCKSIAGAHIKKRCLVTDFSKAPREYWIVSEIFNVSENCSVKILTPCQEGSSRIKLLVHATTAQSIPKLSIQAIEQALSEHLYEYSHIEIYGENLSSVPAMEIANACLFHNLGKSKSKSNFDQYWPKSIDLHLWTPSGIHAQGNQEFLKNKLELYHTSPKADPVVNVHVYTHEKDNLTSPSPIVLGAGNKDNINLNRFVHILPKQQNTSFFSLFKKKERKKTSSYSEQNNREVVHSYYGDHLFDSEMKGNAHSPSKPSDILEQFKLDGPPTNPSFLSRFKRLFKRSDGSDHTHTSGSTSSGRHKP
ncbi:MAG: hypothetical protein V4490_03700 [Pseudomonadota bacterium]